MNQLMIAKLKNRLVNTLNYAVYFIGRPIPNPCVEGVQAVLNGDDEIAFMALGCYVEDCIRDKNYKKLFKGLADIKKGKEKKSSNLRYGAL